jgi:hypothetical protein
MSNDPREQAERRRRKWITVTVVVVAVIALGFYVAAFFAGHYIHGPGG